MPTRIDGLTGMWGTGDFADNYDIAITDETLTEEETNQMNFAFMAALNDIGFALFDNWNGDMADRYSEMVEAYNIHGAGAWKILWANKDKETLKIELTSLGEEQVVMDFEDKG